MLLNECTAITTSRVQLVPYTAQHVPTYHAWMQDEELQKATASEPLSLSEEFDMQRSWRYEKDKLTFIICEPVERQAGKDETKRMLGDVNLFVLGEDGGDDGRGLNVLVGEIELMIAKPEKRRKGYGRAALRAFLTYIYEHIDEIRTMYGSNHPLEYLRVKIDQDNKASISLFECLGFRRLEDPPNHFGEVQLRLHGITDAAVKKDDAYPRMKPEGYCETRYKQEDDVF